MSFLLILTPFVSFPCLVDLARTSSTINVSGKNEHPHLVPDLAPFIYALHLV